MIKTVCGDISDDQLGATLAHEHLYVDLSIHSGKSDNIVTDEALIISELAIFREAGGQSILEMTPAGLGRNPQALQRISEASGVHIVEGISFYQADTYPEWVHTATVVQIADFFMRQIEEGDDGVCSGFLGEITSHNVDNTNPREYTLHEGEGRVFQAAAHAQKRTGVAISTHASNGRGGHAQLDLLEDNGADLTRVVIGHCDTYGHEDEEEDMRYYHPILTRGAVVEFDLIGWGEEWPGMMTDQLRAERLAALIDQGYADQLVISTDTCRLSQMHANGGRGFDFIWRDFLPRLRRLGVTDGDIRRLLVDTPRRLLAIDSGAAKATHSHQR